MTITVYGIANCATVRKARAWFAERGIVAEFHDFKRAGLPPAALDAWLDAFGWETLLNRRGTTWRRLDDAARQQVRDRPSARALMLTQTSLLRRPVIDWHGRLTLGFDPAQWPPH